MFKFYTGLTYIALFTQIIMLLIISSDSLLSRRAQKGFFRMFATFASLTFFEWFSIWLNSMGGAYGIVGSVILRIVFVFAPTIPILVAVTYSKLEHIKVIFGLFFINLVVQAMILFGGGYFYMSIRNLVQEGNLYLIFITVFVITLLIMCYYVYKTSRYYQTKNGFVLLLILVNLLAGFYVQSMLSGIFIFRVAATFSAIFLYMQYCSLINKIDPLTKVFNRRCYTNRINKLNKEAIILYVDVDKFKEVNDTRGHAFGDYCLKELGLFLKQIFGKSGVCFRIGGDEFCVILYKNLEDIEELTRNLRALIDERRRKEPELPELSVGYGCYKKGMDIDMVIEEADQMMYAVKRTHKEQDNVQLEQ